MVLSKAFDTIPHWLLFCKLKAYGDNSRNCLLVEDDLHVRIKGVRLHDAFSDWLEVRGGVPQSRALGPMWFFSIFINDLLSQIKTLQLKMCTEDGQLYTSVTNMLSLEGGMSREVSSANAWYEINRWITSPNKHQGILLGNSEHYFNYSVNDSVYLFRVTIDKNPSFK